jgi:predicted ATPase
MLTKVSIHNFKCLRDVEIELDRFTMFVGPNASGKSSILQALNHLCRSFRDQPGTVENELLEGISQGNADFVELVSEDSDQLFRYRTHSPFTTPQAGSPHNQKWSGEGLAFAPTTSPTDWKPIPRTQPNVLPFPRSILLRMETSKLISSAPFHDPTRMGPDGSGLHSALANMALNDPDSWQELQANLRRIIPTIRRLRHSKTVMNQPPTLLFDTVGAGSLTAQQVSEGTLLVLGLLAALHASSRPNLVLLDDLDRGLHPKAQNELISLLRGLLKAKPDLQICATTHSPYMLDCMDTNEVHMTVLRDDGATVCAPLASHPQFAKWKDEMAPGEMWSLFGEKWLVEAGVAQ